MYNFFSPKYFLLYIIIFSSILNIYIYKENRTYKLILLFVLFTYFNHLYNITGKIFNHNFQNIEDIKEQFIDNNINKTIKIHSNDNYYIDNNEIYPIYRKPKKFLFLQKNKIFQDILYDLRFIKKYDHADYYKLIVLFETFLRIYYNIINDHYDWTYIDNLVDIRKNILNVMYNFLVDAPIFNKRRIRIDDIIHKSIIKTQSYTYTKMLNIHRKYPNKFNPSHPRSISNNDIKDNYQIIV
jgi:hypothetical protein